MKRNTAIAVAAFAAIAVSGAAFAGLRGHGRHGPFKRERVEKMVSWKVEDFLDSIDATATQREKVAALKTRLLDDAFPVFEAGRGLRRDVAEKLIAGKATPAEVHGAIDTQAEKMKALAHEFADAALEVNNMLTPEQRAKVADRLERFHHE